MKTLERSEILDRSRYSAVRNEFRSRTMKIKEDRRIAVGPFFTFLFENKDTVIYQIQEMIHAEGIDDPRAVEHEVLTYSQLLPGEDSLAATLLIEIQDELVRRVKLAELVGIEDHVMLSFDGESVHAQFDKSQLDPAKVSSVQYIRFAIGSLRDKFMNAATVALEVTHPAAHYRTELAPRVLEALRADLRS